MINNLTLKQKVIAAVIVIGVILIAIFRVGFGGEATPEVDTTEEQVSSDQARILSVTPEGLLEKDKSVFIVPTQVIEIVFSESLVNGPETRVVLDPVADVKVEISGDGKTAKVIPQKPYKLGQGYTMFVKGETKFNSSKKLDKEYDFHFNTIGYSGI